MKNNITIIIILILVLLLVILLSKCKKSTINNNVPFKIDLVYTWSGENLNKENKRTSFNNELKYSLRSVFKYLPWINHIYIVINSPLEENKPSWFNDKYHNKITLVDQKEIFPKDRHSELPCKVSDIIETYIHLIQGLSEHFIYINDDFFINKQINYTEFFNNNGSKIKVEKNINEYEKINFNNNLKLSNYPYNSKSKWYHPHIVYPMTISSRSNFIDEYKEWIQWVRDMPYTSRLDIKNCNKFGLYINCIGSHYPYYIYMYINNNTIINKNLYDTYIDCSKMNNIYYSFYINIRIHINNPLFYVINGCSSNYKDSFTKFIHEKFPDKQYFEK